MPDQTVQVTFTSPSSWTFVPDNATMTAAGRIILIKSPANQSWSFVSASVKNDTTNQFHPHSPAQGELTITDDHSSNGTWDYSVTVSLNGTQYTSPDPQITNSDPNLR